MTILYCTSNIIETTVMYLREAGRERKECVVLWLAPRQSAAQDLRIVEVYRPLQHAKADQFWIPPEAMTALMRHLRAKHLKLATQVHSHPCAAFHSPADDHWTIIRHIGALSIVIPDFASHTDTENFTREAKVFSLSPDDRWLEVADIARVLEIEP
jgi:proteasome lid subunit RPN8/RPN11